MIYSRSATANSASSLKSFRENETDDKNREISLTKSVFSYSLIENEISSYKVLLEKRINKGWIFLTSRWLFRTALSSRSRSFDSLEPVAGSFQVRSNFFQKFLSLVAGTFASTTKGWSTLDLKWIFKASQRRNPRFFNGSTWENVYPSLNSM